MTHAQAGRRGGLVTLERHGVEFYRQAGKKGGRPRALTLSQIRQSAAPVTTINKTSEGGRLSANLKTLKALFKAKYGERLETLPVQEDYIGNPAI